MDKDVIELRNIIFELGCTENAAESIGISRRQLDRYMSRDSKGVPLKIMNSARWVLHSKKVKGT